MTKTREVKKKEKLKLKFFHLLAHTPRQGEDGRWTLRAASEMWKGCKKEFFIKIFNWNENIIKKLRVS